MIARSNERVAIVACDGKAAGPSAAPLQHLRRLAPSASLESVKDLCTSSRALSTALRAHTGDFVVLLPCRSHRGLARASQLRERVSEWSAAAVNVVIVDPADLLANDDDEWATLAAVAASSVALVGSASVGVLSRPPVAAGVSRRAVLAGKVRERRPTPHLAHERCSASRLCRLCRDACSTSALVIDDGAPRVDSNGCDSCGACVLACPQDVLELSTMPRQVWESLLQHVLVGAREVGLPIGIWWSCDDATDRPTARPGTAWLRLRVPCVRALTPAWILQPLSHGAAEVTVTSCSAAGAEWGADGSMLRLLGELVASLPATPSSSRVGLREPAGTVDALAGRPPTAGTFIASQKAPLGVVNCDARICTGCGVCADNCPTGALWTTTRPTSWSLSFAHASCVACGACVNRCPEDALSLRRGVQPADLRLARELVTTSLARCVVCGAGLATPTLMARLADVGVRVPDDGRCGDCRAADRTTNRSA